MRTGRIRKARVRHLLARPQRLEECLKLRLIRVITHIAGVHQLRGQRTPFILIQRTHLAGVELVIQNTALTTHEVCVEVVWLQAVNHAGHLTEAAIIEFQDRDTCSVVFVLLENSIFLIGRMT